ncbi:MAG: bifunctional DNA-formamidopyrimidine glycosylase/DNA-(apurinic or apyrimidinic site) lyase [Clostridia bacterium]|nr:bifunctional DNA-formamidopyrimidine glycosylase/DNA-(apurinic or apyrimidinic site) lyase [Clostridia bacterium]
MPELPEVETIKQSLAPYVLGQRIREVTLYQPRVVARPGPEDFCRLQAGATVRSLARRGKYLLFYLEEERVLVVHLRLTGRLVWQASPGPLSKHTHVVWHLDNGFLLYEDLRRFGRLWLVRETELVEVAGLAALGPEPLGEGLGGSWAAAFWRRDRPLKSLLLDQRFVAGIGNIYADEILHRAGLHPLRRAATLSKGEAEALAEAIRNVLTEAIEHRGTSIRDYVDGQGASGQHQDFLQVHGRAGKACYRCGTPVVRIKLGGRGTYFCPGCQQ